jgi:uncharacterized protein YecE (DUF72 family)
MIAIGTSGWSYRHWAGGAFYPSGLASGDWLEYYVSRFPTVEINASFYRMPRAEMVARWREIAPPGFAFAAKGSRLITHARRLKECEAPLRKFMERLGGLDGALAVVLWQLPPGMECSDEHLARLDAFLELLPGGVRHAVEFRHPSWLNDESFSVLRDHRAAHVAVSSTLMPRVLTLTAGFAYVRMHGLSGGYAHHYTRRGLAPWADFLAGLDRDGKDAYVYFNNDARAQAPKDAGELVRMLAESGVDVRGEHPAAA